MAGLAYVSLEEAAELEGISYETMKKRAQRSSDKMGVKKASRGSGCRSSPGAIMPFWWR